MSQPQVRYCPPAFESEDEAANSGRDTPVLADTSPGTDTAAPPFTAPAASAAIHSTKDASFATASKEASFATATKEASFATAAKEASFATANKEASFAVAAASSKAASFAAARSASVGGNDSDTQAAASASAAVAIAIARANGGLSRSASIADSVASTDSPSAKGGASAAFGGYWEPVSRAQ